MWEIDDAPLSLESSPAAFPATVPAAPAEIGSGAVSVGESDEVESVASAVEVAGRASFCEPDALESAAAVPGGWS